MKITVIHNTYRFNPLIEETVALNLRALQDAGVSYQYIVFNDNGDESIETLVKGLDVQYHYSDINYGKKMCSGGWVGALPLVKGELLHNTGQDDVFTPFFYRSIFEKFNTLNYDLVYANGFKVNEELIMTGETLGPLQTIWDYSKPREVFSQWMGVVNNRITRANNYIPAPGTVYRTSLHSEIGEPDIENFRGVADFEYWVRVLFNRKKVCYLPTPCWLYRMSRYTTTLENIEGKVNEKDFSPQFIDLMISKYQKMLDNE